MVGAPFQHTATFSYHRISYVDTGTCKEFHPKWQNIVERVQGVQTGHVVIDDPAGMAVAQQYGVLNAGDTICNQITACNSPSVSSTGLPAVVLFGRKGMPPRTLMAGTAADADVVLDQV